MGIWMIGTGNITIKPEVDKNLIKEYIQFSKSSFPEAYRDENFANTWFFDEDNKLFSIAGKFAEPSIWYRHIKENFFSYISLINFYSTIKCLNLTNRKSDIGMQLIMGSLLIYLDKGETSGVQS